VGFLHPLGLLIIFLEPLTGAASPLRPRRQPGEAWAHRLLSSPTPNTKKLYTKKLINFLFNIIFSVGMGLITVFRAKLSSHGRGGLIIYIPKDVQPKLRELYEKKVELVVHLYTED
jgi:hypothetical protein